MCISPALLASPGHESCSFFLPSLFVGLFYFLFAVNLMLLKAAGTLPPQTGGFYVFVCARQRSEQFLLLQPQQAEAALAFPWSHSQGQIPTDLPHGGNCTSCLRQVAPTFSFSSLRPITHPQSPIPTSHSHSHFQAGAGSSHPQLTVPAGMLLNLSSQPCCGSEQHPGPSGEP